MDGFTSYFIALAVGVGVLFGLFLIYFRTSIANTKRQLKVDIYRAIDARIEDIWQRVEGKLSGHAHQMRSESVDAGNKLKEEIVADSMEYREQVKGTLMEVAKQLRTLRAMGAFDARGAARSGGQGAPVKEMARREPAAGEAPKSGT